MTAIDTSKTKRRTLTPEERVARLQAELAEAQAKAKAQAGRKWAELVKREGFLQQRKTKLKNQIAAVRKDLAEIAAVYPDFADQRDDAPREA